MTYSTRLNVNLRVTQKQILTPGLVQMVRQALEITPEAAPVSTVIAPSGISIGEKIRSIRVRTLLVVLGGRKLPK